MMRPAALFITSLLLTFCARVQAQDAEIQKQPGYVDLAEITIPDKAGKVTEVSLGPAILKLASQVSHREDEDLTETLSGIHSIQVKSFETDSVEAERILPIMDKFEVKLNQEKWQRLVRVKDGAERTTVSIKYEKDKVVGLFVMALESSGEVSFVNIIGEINLNSIGNLGVDLDIPALDSLKKSAEGK
jgi:hypothetical protein